jgi:hypothetical protein
MQPDRQMEPHPASFDRWIPCWMPYYTSPKYDNIEIGALKLQWWLKSKKKVSYF